MINEVGTIAHRIGITSNCLRALQLVVLFGCALIASASDSVSRLPPEVSQALQKQGIPEASVGIYVQDSSADRPLIALGEDRPLNPASTIKLLTTFSALDQLGPAYAWTTEVYTRGAVEDEVLNGDLIIKGYGDPRLTLENFWLMLRALRARGIREIRGDLVLDRSYFAGVERSDPAAFDNEPTRPYNTLPSALLVNFKAIRVRFTPDRERRRLLINAEPALAQIEILSNVTLDAEPCGDWLSRLKLTAASTDVSVRLLFAGAYSSLCGENERSYSVLNELSYFRGLFEVLWKELGGRFSGGIREGEVSAGAQLIYSHRTQPLADIVRDINKFSNNVMARQLYLTLGAILSGAPASLAKSERSIRAWLATRGLTLPALVLENGSGLSRNERISARGLAQLLLHAQRSTVFPEFMASLPLAAVDGTMVRRLQGAQIAGRARIKTGSLTGVRAIAGYVLDQKGRSTVVVFIVNHPEADGSQAAQDALLRWVYAR